jgi:hypothetical protein
MSDVKVPEIQDATKRTARFVLRIGAIFLLMAVAAASLVRTRTRYGCEPHLLVHLRCLRI